MFQRTTPLCACTILRLVGSATTVNVIGTIDTTAAAALEGNVALTAAQNVLVQLGNGIATAGITTGDGDIILQANQASSIHSQGKVGRVAHLAGR